MKRPVKHRTLVSPINWRSREHARKLQIKVVKANDESIDIALAQKSAVYLKPVLTKAALRSQFLSPAAMALKRKVPLFLT